MTCNIAQTTPDQLPWLEPSPPYYRHDPETASIHSAAPSYVSETPTYTSQAPFAGSPGTPSSSLLPPAVPGQRTQGLPAMDFAPGFRPLPSRIRNSASSSDMYRDNCNPGSDLWSSTRTSVHRRQFEAVARRRGNRAANANNTSKGSTPRSYHSAKPLLHGQASANGSRNASSVSVDRYLVTERNSSDPVTPLEDPDLVGEDAAQKARARRVYMEMALKEEEVEQDDSRSWEFMFFQMADWEERPQVRKSEDKAQKSKDKTQKRRWRLFGRRYRSRG